MTNWSDETISSAALEIRAEMPDGNYYHNHEDWKRIAKAALAAVAECKEVRELRALLEECEGVVAKAVDAAENFPDIHDGRVEPTHIIEHLHEWEATHLGFGKIAGADDLLTKLHAAGIGGK